MGVKLQHLTIEDQQNDTDAAKKYKTSFISQFQQYLLPIAGQSCIRNAYQTAAYVAFVNGTAM